MRRLPSALVEQARLELAVGPVELPHMDAAIRSPPRAGPVFRPGCHLRHFSLPLLPRFQNSKGQLALAGRAGLEPAGLLMVHPVNALPPIPGWMCRLTSTPFRGAASYGRGLCKVRRNAQLPKARWRAGPDSNRLPPVVLQVCFRKHLPPVSPPPGRHIANCLAFCINLPAHIPCQINLTQSFTHPVLRNSSAKRSSVYTADHLHHLFLA